MDLGLIIALICGVLFLLNQNRQINTKLNTTAILFENLRKNFVETDFTNRILKENVNVLEKENLQLKDSLEAETLRNNEVLSQKKSSEVKVGAITENLVPLLHGLPYDATNLKHLGQPLDYVYFDYNGPEGVEIVFIEVKSGKAKESKRQKLLKNAIKLGKVHYEELRVDETGVSIKRAKNED
jgi:predicted Holliday junction resolvase-like endonuclease